MYVLIIILLAGNQQAVNADHVKFADSQSCQAAADQVNTRLVANRSRYSDLPDSFAICQSTGYAR